MDLEPNAPPTQPQWSSVPPPPPEKQKFPVWGWILVVLGVCCCGGIPILAAILFPVFSQAKIAAQTTASMSNLKQLNIAFQIYAADSDDFAMPKENWNEVLMPYTKAPTLLEDPLLSPSEDNLGYGYNGAMSKVEIYRLESPMDQVVFGLTTSPGKDALITKDSVRSIHKASGQTLIGYADAHVSKVDIPVTKTQGWQPKLSKK
ncbi:MAG TPA: hypothetical protein VK171_15130 [Fimbriimonas sp.]|nr:hypothetical protein [Fimbriimonas sp.]